MRVSCGAKSSASKTVGCVTVHWRISLVYRLNLIITQRPYVSGHGNEMTGVEVGEGINLNHREVPLLLARDGAGSIPNWMVRLGGNFLAFLSARKRKRGREPSFCGVELLYCSV